MYKIISPIRNLVIDQDLPENAIFQSKTLFKHFDKNFIESVGTSNIDTFFNSPSIFFETENFEGSANVYLHERGNTFNYLLSVGYWLVKDSSCYSPLWILINTKDGKIIPNFRNAFFSNSTGTYLPVFFSKQESLEGLAKFEKLLDLLHTKDQPQLVSVNGQIAGSISTANYNDFERIDRAVNFIQYARATSIVPQKISNYIVALEALFGNDEKDDLNFKLKYRIPHFFDKSKDEKKEISEIVKLGYGIRSRFLHGSKLDKKQTREFLNSVSTKIDNLLRETINLLIDNEESRKTILSSDEFNEFFHEKLIG